MKLNYIEWSHWQAKQSPQYLKYLNHLTENEVRYRVHKSPPLVPALMKIYPDQALSFRFYKTLLNIISRYLEFPKKLFNLVNISGTVTPCNFECGYREFGGICLRYFQGSLPHCRLHTCVLYDVSVAVGLAKMTRCLVTLRGPLVAEYRRF